LVAGAVSDLICVDSNQAGLVQQFDRCASRHPASPAKGTDLDIAKPRIDHRIRLQFTPLMFMRFYLLP
jgi:hypothetical protein